MIPGHRAGGGGPSGLGAPPPHRSPRGLPEPIGPAHEEGGSGPALSGVCVIPLLSDATVGGSRRSKEESTKRGPAGAALRHV